MTPSRERFVRRFHEGLPPHLRAMHAEVEARAVAVGLDTYPIHFELVDTSEMAALAAHGGFPTRYPHWRFGMAYDEYQKTHRYGLQKIYEMVINTDPCVAYLVDTNTDTDHKMVMAHVYGHCDFFKHNLAFAHTDRRMIDRMANHAARVQRHIDRFGYERVEAFLDACLSLENLIDVHSAMNRSTALPEQSADDLTAATVSVDEMRLEAPWDEDAESAEAISLDEEVPRIPERPERDVLGFLIRHAPLTDWQQDLLAIVRDEALYFAPQGRTKIMNEGWATFWHTRIMTGNPDDGPGLLEGNEIIHYAEHHSGTVYMRPGSLNPYRLGLLLWRHIWDRWNKGRFGPEWDACDNARDRHAWDTGAGLGREHAFLARRVHTDVSFVDTYLDEDFCREHGLFALGREVKSGRWVVRSRDVAEVRAQLLSMLENGGQPVIEVEDANHNNRSELRLVHRHTGKDLQFKYVESTLGNLARIWRRPAILDTLDRDKLIRYRHDGSTCSRSEVS